MTGFYASVPKEARQRDDIFSRLDVAETADIRKISNIAANYNIPVILDGTLMTSYIFRQFEYY
jgi:hypothetical protein